MYSKRFQGDVDEMKTSDHHLCQRDKRPCGTKEILTVRWFTGSMLTFCNVYVLQFTLSSFLELFHHCVSDCYLNSKLCLSSLLSNVILSSYYMNHTLMQIFQLPLAITAEMSQANMSIACVWSYVLIMSLRLISGSSDNHHTGPE